LKTQRDKLLRTVRRVPQSRVFWPRVLGVDDWAWQRGRRYGTLLVDLERHSPVDLLPDRRSQTLVAWLQQHPDIEVICRDRAGAYAEAATLGAPQAVQVADRWHLLQNLSQALTRALERRQAALSQAARSQLALTAAEVKPQPEASTPTVSSAASRHLDREKAEKRMRRLARYSEVRGLAQQGYSQRSIARQLGLSRKTVTRFAEAERFPERAERRPRPNLLDAFLPYLQSRWQQGCHNAAQLWREIQAQGFVGSATLLRSGVASWRGQSLPITRSGRSSSARQVAWWLLRYPQELEAEQCHLLAQLYRTHPEVEAAATLAQEFRQMLSQRQEERLDRWLAQASSSSLPELRSFAAGLSRDQQAVAAAVRLDWSNGQVEGQIHRLKLIKRQAYGRAKLDLLRARVLYAA
jgi:transposase